MTITLNQETPSDDTTLHGWVLRDDETQIDVWDGDITDIDGAKAWGIVTLRAAGIPAQSWTQDDGGHSSDWPYWTANTQDRA